MVTMMVERHVEPMSEELDALESPDDNHAVRIIRERLHTLPGLPGYRAEIIKGNLIVSPAGTPEHGLCHGRLLLALAPVMAKAGWEAWPGTVDVCIEGPRDMVTPDYVLAPLTCPRWGDALLSSGLVMAAEVVSFSSVRQDCDDKREIFAKGGVPIYLLIDPIAKPERVTVYSDIREGVYAEATSVPMGKPLYLPSPIDFDLDTSIFMV